MKLTTDAYDKLVKSLRLLNPDFRNQVAPLVHHCNWLKNRCLELEQEILVMKQGDLLKDVDNKPERIYLMLHKKQYNILERFLRCNKMQRSQAIEIANVYAEKSGYCKIIE